MVEKIEAFITSDGSLFINELEAYKYECDYLGNNQKKYFVTKTNIKIEYVTMFTIASLMDIKKRSLLSNKVGAYMWFHTVEKKGYVGSSDNLYRRCSDFLNPNNRYGGEKIQKIRNEGIDKFVFLLLEEVSDKNNLIEKEIYYVEKYDTIKNGYNTRKPVENPCRIGKKYTEEQKKEVERIKSAREAYKIIVKNIDKWGFKIGDTMNLENWTNHYIAGDKSGNHILSFRLSCFLKNKNTVEYEDLLQTGLYIKNLLDIPRYGYRCENDEFPSSIIRYRTYDEKYLSVHNNVKNFNNSKDAIIFYVEDFIRTKILEHLKDKKLISNIKNMTVEDLIELRYKDYDKIINFLHGECEYDTKKVG